MKLIGKTTINPVFFYTGKVSGYITYIIFAISVFGLFNYQNISFIYNNYIAYFLLFIGLVFVVLSLINLGSSTRLGIPTETTSFKTKGLYKISRNPMYVGFNLLTFASIIFTLNIVVLILGVYSFIIYHFIILGEEKFLNSRFGTEYIAYKQKVRRYIKLY
jgi:protein-S-isoprenylcysteine O-methyltransferase Ste14